MDFKELQEFIKSVVATGAAEVEVETEDIRIFIKNQPLLVEMPTNQSVHGGMVNYSHLQTIHQTAMESPVSQPTSAKELPKIEIPENQLTIKSPMVGTFYRRPTPDKPAFINVGDEIVPGKVLCMIEAMKLFNEIESDVSGKIVKILIEDATPVEYDQPLFLIEQ